MNTAHDPRDQDGKAELAERKALRDAEWLRGLVGEASYLAGLKCLGYLPADARAELWALKSQTLDRTGSMVPRAKAEKRA